MKATLPNLLAAVCCLFLALPCTANASNGGWDRQAWQAWTESKWSIGLDIGYAPPELAGFASSEKGAGLGFQGLGSQGLLSAGANALYRVGESVSMGLAAQWGRFLREHTDEERSRVAMDSVSVLLRWRFDWGGSRGFGKVSVHSPVGIGLMYGTMGQYSTTAARLDAGLNLCIAVSQHMGLVLGFTGIFLYSPEGGTTYDAESWIAEETNKSSAWGGALQLDAGMQFRF